MNFSSGCFRRKFITHFEIKGNESSVIVKDNKNTMIRIIKKCPTIVFKKIKDRIINNESIADESLTL